MTPEQWRTVIDVNLTGAFTTISATAPHLVRAGGGRIVATASLAGRQGMAGIAHYVASKWGLIGLVKTSAIELGPHHITVNAVAPTLVATASLADVPADIDAPSGPDHPIPVDAVDPADVANSVTFLFSDAARYISGACLDVTAGAGAFYTA